jgi:hypothetical protein
MFAVVAIAIAVIYIHSQPQIIVAVGQPVRQDDFLYTVTRVVKHRENANIAYIVTIRVDNQAKVVDYRWRDESAYVAGATGRQYRALPDSRSGLDRPPIPAGESAAYTLTFVLPANEQLPMLRYSNGILMGDVFDGAAYRRAAIPL